MIKEMDEDAKKIDYLIEFVIKRNLENYSMFKDYQNSLSRVRKHGRQIKDDDFAYILE